MALVFNGYIHVTLNLATMVVFDKAYCNALSIQLTTSFVMFKVIISKHGLISFFPKCSFKWFEMRDI